MIYPDQPPICDDCLQWKDDRHVCPAINGCGCCGRATTDDWWCHDCAKHVLPDGPPHEATWYAQHDERCPFAAPYQCEDRTIYVYDCASCPNLVELDAPIESGSVAVCDTCVEKTTEEFEALKLRDAPEIAEGRRVAAEAASERAERLQCVIADLLATLIDIQHRAKRIREDKAVVGVEAHYIEQIAKSAIANCGNRHNNAPNSTPARRGKGGGSDRREKIQSRPCATVRLD